MKKQIIAILTVVTLLITMAGCALQDNGSSSSAENSGQSTEAADAAADVSADVKEIGILLPTVDAEYFVGIEDTIKNGLGEEAYHFTTASYNWSAEDEIQAMENFMIQGVDAVIVVTFDNAADSAFKEAMDNGIKVVVAGTQPANYSYCVISDNVSIGKVEAGMAVDWINSTLGGKAEIAILSSEASVSGADRAKGMQEVIEAELPDSEIVLVQDPGSSTGSGTEFAENLLLRFPNVNVVLSISDDRGVEVYEAFRAAGHTGDEVAVYGCDCNTQVLKNISDGTIYRGSVDTGNYGKEIVSIIPALLSGDDSIGTETVCLGEPVTIDNVADYLN